MLGLTHAQASRQHVPSLHDHIASKLPDSDCLARTGMLGPVLTRSVWYNQPPRHRTRQHDPPWYSTLFPPTCFACAVRG